ncbi:MAG: cysteine desulfurase family protein [Pseudomonadota bacterium]
MHYMDHNATTPLDPNVWEAMLPYYQYYYANASSRHRLGMQQRDAVESARERIANVLRVEPVQIIFTSGGTEANNLFLYGASYGRMAKSIWVGAYEHPSIMEPAKTLARKEWQFKVIPGQQDGTLDLDAWQIDKTLMKDSIVSAMLVNNETGVIFDIKKLAERLENSGTCLHTDATQAIGKIPVDFEALGVDALTLSAHKCYGPKGIGALVVSKRLDIAPQIIGGGHERGRRSGTEPVPLIVGFAEAVERAEMQREAWVHHVKPLRDKLEHELKSLGAMVFAENTERVANTTYFGFDGIHGDSWVIFLDEGEFAVSSGSACSTHKSVNASSVLQAMGYQRERAETAVRISLGWATTVDAVEALLVLIKQGLTKFSKMPAMYLV